jgi:hypothetical protein
MRVWELRFQKTLSKSSAQSIGACFSLRRENSIEWNVLWVCRRALDQHKEWKQVKI